MWPNSAILEPSCYVLTQIQHWKHPPEHCVKSVFKVKNKGTRTKSKSSRPEAFCENGVLKNFTKLTGKHLCQSLFFNKVAGLSF